MSADMGNPLLASRGGASRPALWDWSMVVVNGAEGSVAAAESMDRLCQGYWYPLYAYARRGGVEPDVAERLVRVFVTGFQERRYLDASMGDQSRLRVFLRGAFDWFRESRWTGLTPREVEEAVETSCLRMDGAELRYRAEVEGDGAVELYEAAWRREVLGRALTKLGDECRREGRGELFERLRGQLWGPGSEADRASVAVALGMSEGTVGSVLQQMRQRLQGWMRFELAGTVATDGLLESECEQVAGRL